jgi:hypothetical protein
VKPGRRFAFGHEPALPRAAPRMPVRADVTVPLPDLASPAASTGEGRPTLPLADGATARPALPFRAPAAPVLQREVTPLPREAEPVRVPRRVRVGAYAAIVAGAVALYSAALVAAVALRRAERVPVETTPSASPTTRAAADIPPTELACPPSSAPAPEVIASMPAPPASASSSALPVGVPRIALPHVERAPASMSAHTARPAGGDVRDPWGDDR